MVKHLATLLLFSAPASALACSCEAFEGTVEAHVAGLFEASEVVGVFRVDGPGYKRVELPSGAESGRWYTLNPERLFKGQSEVRFARAAPMFLRSSCDIRYSRGDLVLVYAARSEVVRLSYCAASGSLMSRFDHLPVLFRLSESWR